MNQPAAFEHVIHHTLRTRYSPRAFDGKPLARGCLRQLLEAARRAPSCFNAQPWRFIVAERQHSEAFKKMLDGLVPFNQSWAKNASALIITVAQQHFSHNGKPNPHAWHDVGLAMGALTAQAQSMGISLHQMAGIDNERIRQAYGIDEGYQVVTAIAVGYVGDGAQLPPELRAKEGGPRPRLPQRQLVFAGEWGHPARLDGEAEIEELLSFWFGELDEHGLADAAHSAKWWKKDPAFDQLLRERFGALHVQVLAGGRDAWLRSARGCLAQVIVLDQLSRNMYRDTPEMYAADARAVAVASQAIAMQLDLSLATAERVFLYMPFMHAEDLPAQERCVTLMSELAQSVDESIRTRVENNVTFAQKHRDIVRDWGRFPHRNAILGRPSSVEEEAFLKQPGSSF